MNLLLTFFSSAMRIQRKQNRLTGFLLLLVILLAGTTVSARVYSENKKISINVKDVQLRELFREIENNSEYAFFFNDQFKELETMVSMDITDENINTVMARLLDNTGLDYKIMDNNFIVIVPRESFQPGEVKGTVTDASGNPLPGVNIIEKGTSNGVVTSIDGKYAISVASPDALLVFSFVGYNTEEVLVGSQTVLDLTLIESLEVLNEVVVVGYGSMQRTNVTGSISSLKSEDIERTPVPNLIEALRGQIPGMRITRSDGTPGSDVEFTIRGKRSIGAAEDPNNPENNVNANEPLLVVDGVPFTGGKISDINPEDVESIDVLKDAAATSIYGSSASNGVILITTKSGLSAKPSLTFSASTGFTNLVHKPEMFDGAGYVQLQMDALAGNPRNTLPIELASVLDPVEMENYLAGQETDWHDVVMRDDTILGIPYQGGKVTQMNLALTGGKDKFHYYMNGDLYREFGFIQRSTYNRYSFRINADYAPYNFVKLGARVQYVVSDADETSTTMGPNGLADFTDFIGNSPWGETHDSLGNLRGTVSSDQFQHNPLYRYDQSEVGRNNYRASITPFVEFTIIDGLTYRINGFAEMRNERYTRWLKSAYDPYNLGENTYEIDFGMGSSYLLDNILNYTKTFAQKHMVNATIVNGFQSNRYEDLIINASDSTTNYIGIYDIENINANMLIPELNPKKSGKYYYVARVGYSYDNRYNITLSRRWDYTSQFGPNEKKGVFSSAAFAWNIHNEVFMENLSLFNLLKVRLSYGEVGNDRIPQFSYLYTSLPATYTWNGQVTSGWSTGESGNYGLRWETSLQGNFGIDFSILQNRIMGNFDVYASVNKDLLYEEQVPIIFGDNDGLIMSNVAETNNYGFDGAVTGKIFDGDFKWYMTVNWAKDKNWIVTLGEAKVDSAGNPIDDPANGWFIGQDIDVVYDYNAIGIWQTGEDSIARIMHPDKASYYGAGDPRIEDINGDGIIDDEDKTFLGSSVTPRWYGGISNTFMYKGFELSILIEAVRGITKVNQFINSLTGRDNTVYVNYWTPENPDGDFPQPNSRNVYDYENAVRIQDASFIALRNVSLTYNLPQSLVSKMKMQNCAVYIRGNNLGYLTKFKQAYSPESDWGKFPITKMYTFGLNVTF